MANGIFGVAISGLRAAQAGLATAGHNIANANTPGYHRQVVVQSNAPAYFTGAGFIGRGVEVDTVRRVYSELIDAQAARAQAQAAYYTTYEGQIGQIDNLLSDPDAGLAPELERFFAAVNEVAASPASAPSRQAMLAGASSLVARFQALDNRLNEINQSINVQIESTVSSVNAYAREIAHLNGRIAAAGQEHPPNDLLDQRDRLVGELNVLVGASVIGNADGTVNVSMGSGQSLVVAQEFFRLSALPSPEVPEQIDVGYGVGGGTVLLPPKALSGGSLGALLAFRGEALTDARNQLGRIAAGLQLTFNAQHRLGQDLRGGAGTDFFSAPTAAVSARADNGGNADLRATLVDAAALVASDYRIAYAAGNYRITRLSDGNTTNFAALPQTIDGITLQLAGGVPADGDSFLVEPGRYVARNMSVAVHDTALIAAAAPMRTGSGAANTGTAVVSQGSVTAPLNGNVQQPVSIVFTSPTTFNVVGVGTGDPVGVAYTSGGDISFNGWTIKISGTPAAGDTFTVTANTNGIADSRNALALAQLQTTNTLAGSTSTFQGAYGQLTGFIGNTTREMSIASKAQEAIAARAVEAQQSVSGVNLDEEAANLMRYQQAYQASAKTIQVAVVLFDTILELGN
jgi:flagellar hook-associated protein 1 FlgK